MNETQEPRLTEKPAWLDLPEKSSYWGCFGVCISKKEKWWKRKTKSKTTRRVLHYTKEDAEAYASIPNSLWIWNKKPATEISLQYVMNQARVAGDLGVEVMSYQNGKWVVVKRYPCGVPLRED